MTITEIQWAISGWQEQRKEDGQERITQAWLTALWTMHVEKFPSLEDVLGVIDSKPKTKPTSSIDDGIERAKELGLKGPWS